MPRNCRANRDPGAFAWDDWQAGQPNPPYLPPPNHIVSIREGRYKLARYYDVNGNVPDQWEMYDLQHDPLEKRNIAWHDHRRTDEQEEQLRRLTARLAEVERTRLAPLPNTPVITSAETPRRDGTASAD